MGGNLRTILTERVLYPLYQIKFGPAFGFNVINIRNVLDKTQWLSSTELSEYQTSKLRRLIQHVYNNVPYYSDIMHKKGLRPEDIRSAEDLKHFPVLTKKEIRENFDSIVSADIKKRRIIKASTSGTTGNPLIYYRDMNTFAWQEAARLRGWSWAQYQMGVPVIRFASPEWPSLLGKIRIGLINEHEYPAFAKNDELKIFFLQIKKLQPFCLSGMASNLFRMANVCAQNDIEEIQFPVVFSSAEMLYGYQRNFLEKHFKSQVYDFYGCNEIGSMAYECEYRNKHITEEHVVFEVIDSKGKCILDKPGEIAITDLDNFAMPFIRYKLGDVGTLTRSKCDCGRELNVLTNVEGRTQDFLKTLDGNYVPSVYFPTRFRDLKGIEQYQIIQNDIYNIILKIVKNEFYSCEELADMIRVMKEMIGASVNIQVEEYEHISLTGRGKSRLVISNVPKEFN